MSRGLGFRGPAGLLLGVGLLCTAVHAAGATGQEARVASVRVGEPSGSTVTLHLTLEGAGPAWVEYGVEGGPWFRLEDPTASTRHALLLARLEPGRVHGWVVGAGPDTVRGSIQAPPLPEGLASLELRVAGRPTHPLTLLETGQRPGFRGLVAVDGRGRIVWWCDVGGIVHGAARRRNGNWVVGDPTYGLREVTPACAFLRGLPRVPGRTIHHDHLEAPDGAILYLAREERTVDGTALTGEFVRRWVPETGEDGEVWSSFEHLDPEWDRSERSRPANWLHANSLAWGPRGNLVVGLAHLDQVISLSPGLGSVEWRMGGPGATHPVVDGLPFSGQHTASEVAPGRVLLLDNDFAGTRRWSRAVEYGLDARGAHEIWSFRPPVDNWSRVAGSAGRLENGNTLVAFGANPRSSGSTGPMEVYEVTARGQVVWHLVLEGRLEMVYRASPLTTLAGETAVARQEAG